MCDSRSLRRDTTRFRRTVDGIVFEVELSRIVCADCRESFVDVEPLERFEHKIVAELVRLRRCTPAALAFMRKVLGRSDAALAELFGATPETLGKPGKRPRKIVRIKVA